MFATGFMTFAYQTAGNDNQPTGGGGYNPLYQQYRDELQLKEKVRREKTELERLESVLREVERKKELAAQSRIVAQAKRAEALARIEAAYLEEINRLREIKAQLMRRIKEDESILVIFIMKRRRLRVA